MPTSHTDILAIFFGLQGVCFTYSPSAMAKNLTGDWSDSDRKAMLHQKLRGPVARSYLRRFKNHTIGSTEYLNAMLAYLDIRISPAEFWKAHADVFTVNETMLTLMRQLKAANPFLSRGLIADVDEPRLHHCRTFLQRDVEATISCPDLHVAKTDPKVIRAIKTAFGGQPESVLIVDDDLVFLEKARACGLRTHRYLSQDPARHQLLLATLQEGDLLPT